jgi:hypothetical protein
LLQKRSEIGFLFHREFFAKSRPKKFGDRLMVALVDLAAELGGQGVRIGYRTVDDCRYFRSYVGTPTRRIFDISSSLLMP